ncbi:MAG TPA: hypothetical protein VGK02_00200 [Candidatus Aquicultor sp.]|jgi:hypothetical protein
MGKLIHYYKTYTWALEAGFSEADAKAIALADWQVDILKPDERYQRGRHLNTNWLALLGGLPTQLWYASYYLGQAIRSSNLEDLGTSLHSVQDWIGHGAWPVYGYHWIGPWNVKIFGRTVRLRRYNPDEDLSSGRLERLETITKEYMRQYRLAIGI